MGNSDVECHDSLDVDIVQSKSVTKIHVKRRVGHSNSSFRVERSVLDESSYITRSDFQLTCNTQGTDIRFSKRIIRTSNSLLVSRDGAMLHENNDVPARMRQTLKKACTTGRISWPDVIDKGGNDTDPVEGWYQKDVEGKYLQDASIVLIEKMQNHDANAVKEQVSLFSDLCDANHNFVKVYGMESKGDFYIVATERCDTSLREFIRSIYNPESQHLKDQNKLLKLIGEISTALTCLHSKGISHGNLHTNSIFVDKYSMAKISVSGVIGRIIRFPSTDRFSLFKDATADMLALGHIILFILTGVVYNNEDLTEPKPSNDYLKPIYGCPEALDLLRKLLDKHPAERQITALHVKNHPLLWDPSRKLEFIQAVSDHLQGNNTSVAMKRTTARIPIDDIGGTVCQKNWKERVHIELLEAMENDGKRKHTYKSDCMYGLFRFIRDLCNHTEKIETQIRSKSDVPKEVLEIFQPGGIESYFLKRFPKLVMEAYNLMKQHSDKKSQLYTSFFKEGM